MAAKDTSSYTKGGSSDGKINKRQNSTADEFVLEKVSGVSCASPNSMAANPTNGDIAFAASSIVVFMDPRFNVQSFLENPSGRKINALTFSDDGRYVAFGEVGYSPCIYIYHVSDRKRFSSFKVAGICSVKALEFHQRAIYIAVLCASRYSIELFDLRGLKIAIATFVVEPLGMTLPKVGSYLVVCGHRKLSVFSLSEIDSNVYRNNIVFDRRSVLLGHQSEYTFVDVVSGEGPYKRKVYTITSCGYLCDIKVGDILIDSAARVDECCFCIRYCIGCLFVGCTNNTIKICSPANLSIITSVSDRSVFGSYHAEPNIWKFEADALAIAVNAKTRIVTCAFSDRNRHSWYVSHNKDSLECKAIIPVDENGREVAYEPTSYEIRARVVNILNRFDIHKPKGNLKDWFEKPGTQMDGLKPMIHSVRSHFKPSSSSSYYLNALRFTPDSKMIIHGNADGEIKIFDAITGRLDQVIEAHNAAVTYIDLLFDEHFGLVASGGRDRVIFILDARKAYALVQVLCDHSSAIVSISMAHHNGTLTMVSSAADGVILIRQAIKGKHLRFVIVGELSEFGGKPRIYAHGNDYIITGGDNGRFNFFQTNPYISTKPTKTIKSTTKGKRYMKAVAIDPSGCFLVANCAAGTLVFNTQTGKHISTLTKMLDVSLITFSSNIQSLVSESTDGCKFLWRLPQKMIDVMRTKMGGPRVGQGKLRWEKILSNIDLSRKSPDAKRRSSDMPLDYSPENEGKLCYQDKAKDYESIHNSSSECDTYSSCTTCSRSYTDVVACSNRRNVFQYHGDHVANLSEEARRLLCDADEASSTITPTEKTTMDSSEDSKRRTGNHPSSMDSLSGAAGKAAKNECGPRKGSFRRATELATAHRQRKFHIAKAANDESKRTAASKLKSPDSPTSLHANENSVDNATRPKKVSMTPGSEYMSVASNNSLSEDQYPEKNVQPIPSVDSKTITQSEIVSELHDYFVSPPCQPIEQHTDDSDGSGEIPEQYYHSTVSACQASNIEENGDEVSQEDINEEMSSEKKNNLTHIISPESGAARESVLISSPTFVLDAGDGPFSDLSSKTRKPETLDPKRDQEVGTTEGDDLLTGDAKGCFQSGESEEKRDSNQNTASSVDVESNCTSSISHLSTNHSNVNCEVKPSSVYRDISSDRAESNECHGVLREGLKFEVDQENATLGSDNNFKRLEKKSRKCTHLSNSQETFYDLLHELKNLEREKYRMSKSTPQRDLKSPAGEDDSEVGVLTGIFESKSCRSNPEVDNKLIEETTTGNDVGKGEQSEIGSNDNFLQTSNNSLVEEIGLDNSDCRISAREKSETGDNQDNLTPSSLGVDQKYCDDTHEEKTSDAEEEGTGTDEGRMCNGNVCLKTTSITTTTGTINETKRNSPIRPQTCSTNKSVVQRLLNEFESKFMNKLYAKSELSVADSMASSMSTESNRTKRCSYIEGENGHQESAASAVEQLSSFGGLPGGDAASISAASSCISRGLREKGKRFQAQMHQPQGITTPDGCDSSPPSQNVIEGLGSVVDLFRNQDDYLRRLREVRRHFEMSIQALRSTRNSHQLWSTRKPPED